VGAGFPDLWTQSARAPSGVPWKYVATRNGGQKIYLMPSLDAVVVMTGGNYNSNFACG
jgi:hypothetical protein